MSTDKITKPEQSFVKSGGTVISDTIDISELQNMINYIRYKELVSKSQATQEVVDYFS
jgi:hypothetical protein